MPFTVDLTAKDAAAMPVSGAGKHFVLRRTVDFTVTANQVASAATMGLFLIPAYVLVKEVFLVVKTADAQVNDIDIGSFTTAGVVTVVDGFHDGTDPTTTGIKRDVAGETYSVTNGTVGYVAAAAWAVGLTNNDADTINDAVIDFCAECIDLR